MKKLINICLVALFASCNPVKQVLNSPEKFAVVKEAVIRSGACVNDTVTVETTKDSIVYKDSIIEVKTTVPCKDFDTTLKDGTNIKVSGGVLKYSHSCKIKEVIKVKTITNSIRDRAYESILQKDIAKLDSIITARDASVRGLQTENKQLKADINWWRFRFFFWLIVALAIIFRKPLIRIIRGFI